LGPYEQRKQTAGKKEIESPAPKMANKTKEVITNAKDIRDFVAPRGID